MNARGVELVAQVRTPRAGAELVIGPEHDVVGEELRAPVEELGECPLPILGVELVLLLHGDPGKLTSLLGHPLAELGVLGLELRKFIASRLPFLAGSGLVRGHLSPPWAVRHLGVAAPYILGGRPSSRTLRPARQAELIARFARTRSSAALGRAFSSQLWLG